MSSPRTFTIQSKDNSHYATLTAKAEGGVAVTLWRRQARLKNQTMAKLVAKSTLEDCPWHLACLLVHQMVWHLTDRDTREEYRG